MSAAASISAMTAEEVDTGVSAGVGGFADGVDEADRQREERDCHFRSLGSCSTARGGLLGLMMWCLSGEWCAGFLRIERARRMDAWTLPSKILALVRLLRVELVVLLLVAECPLEGDVLLVGFELSLVVVLLVLSVAVLLLLLRPEIAGTIRVGSPGTLPR